MLKLLFAALVAACAFMALAVHLNAGPIAGLVTTHPLLFLPLVALTFFVAFLTVLRPHARRWIVRRVLVALGIVAVASLASACNGIGGLSLPGTGGGAAANGALGQFLSDPNCAHHDEATFVTGAGGLPASFQAKVSRDCPARPSAAPLTVGTTVTNLAGGVP